MSVMGRQFASDPTPRGSNFHVDLPVLMENWHYKTVQALPLKKGINL